MFCKVTAHFRLSKTILPKIKITYCKLHQIIWKRIQTVCVLFTYEEFSKLVYTGGLNSGYKDSQLFFV